MFKKNDFVIHLTKLCWGKGIITKDQHDKYASVSFENVIGIKTLDLSVAKLQLVEDPGQSRLFLENILIDNEHKGIPDRQPFPAKVTEFINKFKGGFYGAVLEKYERLYKQQAHEQFVTQLNESEFKYLMESGQWDELTNRIRKCHSINLLSKFEMIKFSDALKDSQTQKEIGRGLYALLYGEDLIQNRFKFYAGVLEGCICNKWPLITLPLFLCFPKEYMFIKPTVTKEAASNRGFDIQYDSHLNCNTYNQVLLFSRDLFDRLNAYDNPQLHPRDMIDVQTFMWCAFNGGWSLDDITKAEASINSKD